MCHDPLTAEKQPIPVLQSDERFRRKPVGTVRVSRRFFAALLAVLFWQLVTGEILKAQFTTASLGGTVLDSSGGVVPGARVTAQNTETGFRQTAVTDATGTYLFSRLPIGTYKLTSEKEGFTSYVQSGIQLTVNQVATQNVTLNIGSITQQVAVSADTSLVTTQSATLSQVVNERQVVDLPLDGRQVQQLVFLSAGITNTSSRYCLVNCEVGVYPGQQYAKANGTSVGSINYQMDGVSYNDVQLNASLPFPNADAVQEFSEQHSNMSAEYGNAVGGVVNVVTKSGTNQIHGALFEYLRNGSLNARNFFAPKPDTLKRNQFGVSVGGPIQRDRLFYFGTYQGTRIRSSPEGQVSFVPTAAERNGDFSTLLPGTQLVDPVTGTAFAGNRIPANQLSPVSQYFLKLIPLPTEPDGRITYLGPAQSQNDDQFLIKADYIRGKHQFSGRYFYTNFDQEPSAIEGNLLRVDGNGNKVRVQNVSITDTYAATPNLLFSGWFGWNQQNGGSLSGAPFCMPDAGVNIASTQPCEISMTVGGGFSVYTNHPAISNRDSWTYRGVATYVKASHELHFGAEVLRVGGPNASTYLQNGDFSFTSNLSGDNIADFMLGRVSQFVQGGGNYQVFTGVQWSAFIQDNWRVNPRLTLNMGLRWDPFFPYQDSVGRVGCFAPGQKSQRFPNAPVGLLFGGEDHDPACPAATMYSHPLFVSPRLGFAYKLTNDGKTSIRGGAGVYRGIIYTIAYIDASDVPPFSPAVGLTDVSFQDPYGSAGVPNPFPASYGGLNKVPGKDATFPTGPVEIDAIFDLYFRTPLITTWNLTLEREIATNWLVRAAYVGNKGTHLYGPGDLEGGRLELNPAIYIPGHSTVANTQARRMYHDYSTVAAIDSSINSNYNGLQLTTEKRLSYGLSLLANYTYSKELNDFAPAQSGGRNTNPFDRHFDYGPSSDDLAHVFNFSGTYEFPHVAAGGFKDKLVNGWKLSAIVSWHTGPPFTVFSGFDNSFSAVNKDRTDFIGTKISQAQLGSDRSHGEMIQQWFDTSLFVANAVGTFGNTGKNILRGPRFFSDNMSLMKDTKITERTAVQFRAEFFNAFNNVNFDLPDRVFADTAFGQITSAQPPRILQFALKLIF
ncbi:MAG TPA: TonB-dependent receptor [Bryobacteraceae bacterium]|jgi:hypothetical protein